MGKWLIENIPWIFSGVGVFALGLIISMNKKIIPKKKLYLNAGRYKTNI